MGVRIHQARRHQTALRIHYLGPRGLGRRAGAHLADQAVLNQNPSILQNLDLALLRAAARALSLRRRQHPDILYQQLLHASSPFLLKRGAWLNTPPSFPCGFPYLP